MEKVLSHKEECNEALKDIGKMHGLKPWFISAFIDSDDHGICIVVKVNANDPTRVPIRHPNKMVKICTYLIRK